MYLFCFQLSDSLSNLSFSQNLKLLNSFFFFAAVLVVAVVSVVTVAGVSAVAVSAVTVTLVISRNTERKHLHMNIIEYTADKISADFTDC